MVLSRLSSVCAVVFHNQAGVVAPGEDVNDVYSQKLGSSDSLLRATDDQGTWAPGVLLG